MKTMKKLHSSAFTLIELLVVISIIAILASLAIPAVTGAIVKGQLAQATSNARQIYISTQSMALDGVSTSDANLSWPGTLMTKSPNPVNTLALFAQHLVQNGYLAAGDLKVFAAAGIPPATSSSFDGEKNSAFKVYADTEADPGTTVLVATKNYVYNTKLSATDASGKANEPFADKGFVVFRKGGDGSSYSKNQGTNVNIIGTLPGSPDAKNPGTESPQTYLTMQGSVDPSAPPTDQNN